jgi:hypothetical protein
MKRVHGVWIAWINVAVVFPRIHRVEKQAKRFVFFNSVNRLIKSWRSKSKIFLG